MHYLQTLLLTRIRLSTYFWFFCAVFHDFVHHSGLQVRLRCADPVLGKLIPIRVYISPILGAQKARIDAFHQIVRAEANALFGLMLSTKKLPKHLRTEVQSMVTMYVHSKLAKRSDSRGEKEYEKLISFCLAYKGEHADQVEAVLKDIVANQKNRTDFAMQLSNRVYANEWQIMAILFSITLGFVMTLQVSDSWLLHVVRALLCTGLTMLIVILIKLNTLTHKKAKQMWQPLQKLLDTKFYQID